VKRVESYKNEKSVQAIFLYLSDLPSHFADAS